MTSLLAEIADRVAIMADGELVDLAGVDDFGEAEAIRKASACLPSFPTSTAPHEENCQSAPDAGVCSMFGDSIKTTALWPPSTL